MVWWNLIPPNCIVARLLAKWAAFLKVLPEHVLLTLVRAAIAVECRVNPCTLFTATMTNSPSIFAQSAMPKKKKSVSSNNFHSPVCGLSRSKGPLHFPNPEHPLQMCERYNFCHRYGFPSLCGRLHHSILNQFVILHTVALYQVLDKNKVKLRCGLHRASQSRELLL
jgi:hypothetical protein